MTKEMPEQYSVLDSPSEAPPERNPALPLDDEPKSQQQEQQPAGEGEGDASAIDESLLADARAYGLSDDDLAGLSPEQITATLAAIDRHAVSMLARQRQPQQRGLGPQQQQPPFMQQQWPPMGMPPGAPWPGTPQTPGIPQQPGAFPSHIGIQQQQFGQQAPQIQPFELKVSEADGWDPELVKTLKAMNDHYQQQWSSVNQSLQAQRMWYEQQMSGLQQQQEAQFTAWFDGKLSELGDAYHSVFGKGRGDSLRMGSAEYNARLQLTEAMNNLANLYPQASDDELFSRALRMEFGHVSQQLQRQALSDRLKNRSKQTIGRPGQKGKPTADINPQTGLLQSLVDEVQLDIERTLANAQGA